MGCLISCIACEAASCLCCGLTKCCGRVLPTGIAGRIGYTLLFFVVSFFAWILRGWADQILSWIPVLKICEDRQCFGILAIYRLTFALATFHLLHSLMLIGCKDKSDMRAKIQDGFWLIKVVVFIAITFGAFFIPNEFFEVYGWIALIGSLFFILVQLMMLVDFAHSWAEKWIGNYEESGEERGTWWWILLGSSVVLYAISVTLTIVMYIFFVKDAVGCQLNAAFITLNLIFNIGIGALSIHPRIQEANPRSGILQSSFITGYVTYLVWSALMSEPASNGCNPWAASSGASTIALIIGSAFTIIAVCFSTFNTATTFKDDHDQAPLLADKPKDEENTEAPAEEESGPLPYNLSIFHIVFVLGSFYVCMLMSDWFTVDKENETSLKVDSGMASVWVKIVSSWLAILLYVWTLMGPILFPDRDWGVQSFA